MGGKFLILWTALCMLFFLAACKKEGDELIGTFFTLQEAYDGGWLTVDDLRSIADYHNDNIEFPEALDLGIEQAVKETAAEAIRTRLSNPFREAIAGDVSIVGYYGTFNDCVAVLLHDTFTDYPCVIWEESITGVTFIISGANILIWKDNKK